MRLTSGGAKEYSINLSGQKVFQFGEEISINHYQILGDPTANERYEVQKYNRIVTEARMGSENSYNILVNKRKSLETENCVFSEPCTLLLDNIDGRALEICLQVCWGKQEGPLFDSEKHGQEKKEPNHINYTYCGNHFSVYVSQIIMLYALNLCKLTILFST